MVPTILYLLIVWYAVFIIYLVGTLWYTAADRIVWYAIYVIYLSSSVEHQSVTKLKIAM